MTNILVTGAGNVGSALVKKLFENKDNRIFIFDDLMTGNRNKAPEEKNVVFIKLNINNYKKL